MSTEKRNDDTIETLIRPRDILMEYDALTIRFQTEGLLIEDARKKATNTLKAKYSQYDL